MATDGLSDLDALVDSLPRTVREAAAQPAAEDPLWELIFDNDNFDNDDFEDLSGTSSDYQDLEMVLPADDDNDNDDNEVDLDRIWEEFNNFDVGGPDVPAAAAAAVNDADEFQDILNELAMLEPDPPAPEQMPIADVVRVLPAPPRIQPVFQELPAPARATAAVHVIPEPIFEYVDGPVFVHAVRQSYAAPSGDTAPSVFRSTGGEDAYPVIDPPTDPRTLASPPPSLVPRKSLTAPVAVTAPDGPSELDLLIADIL